MKISNKTRFENIFFQILDKTNLNVIKQFKTFIYYVYYTTGAHLFANISIEPTKKWPLQSETLKFVLLG